MLLYLLLTLSVIVLILSLCRENENQIENFSSKSTSESVYNGIEDTNKKCNEIRKKLDKTNEKLMKFYDEVERLRMKKKIAKKVV